MAADTPKTRVRSPRHAGPWARPLTAVCAALVIASPALVRADEPVVEMAAQTLPGCQLALGSASLPDGVTLGICGAVADGPGPISTVGDGPAARDSAVSGVQPISPLLAARSRIESPPPPPPPPFTLAVQPVAAAPAATAIRSDPGPVSAARSSSPASASPATQRAVPVAMPAFSVTPTPRPRQTSSPGYPAAAVFPLLYRGGLVERTGNVSFTIFWIPAGYSVSPNYQSLINRYFQDVGGSDLYGLLTQYADTQGPILNSSSLGGTWVDTTPFPPGVPAQNPLVTADVRQSVIRAIGANGWPVSGVNANYFVYTPAAAFRCSDDPFRTACGQNFCPLHFGLNASNGVTTGEVEYADVGYAGETCGGLPATSPNGDLVADRAVDLTSSVHFNMVTNPEIQGVVGWRDVNSLEIGNKCLGKYGAQDLNGADVILSGHPYLVQQEWSNANAGCVLSLRPPPVCTPRPPVQLATAPASGTLTVTVSTAGTNVALQSIQFGTPTNGLVTGGGLLNSPGNLTLALPAGVSSFTFTINRVTPGQATTVPFVVNDSCGAWPTFAGGGPAAF